MKSGVPQGTMLGPLVFLLYINNIDTNILSTLTIRLFADDCIVYRTTDPECDSHAVLIKRFRYPALGRNMADVIKYRKMCTNMMHKITIINQN